MQSMPTVVRCTTRRWAFNSDVYPFLANGQFQETHCFAVVQNNVLCRSLWRTPGVLYVVNFAEPQVCMLY